MSFTFRNDIETTWQIITLNIGTNHDALWYKPQPNQMLTVSDLDTYVSNLDTFLGNLDTFLGNLDTILSNLDT
jgi:hypothetical protein